MTMDYQLSYEEKPGYLHCRVTGRNSQENVAAYLRDIAREATQRGCQRILIEECLAGPRLDMMAVFAIAAASSEAAKGICTQVAYVDVNAAGDLMQFAQTVAHNRMLPVQVFPTTAAADAWLRQGDNTVAAGQDAARSG